MIKIVIGIIGPIASGKGVVVKQLQKKEFCMYSLSDVIRDELDKRGKNHSRKNMVNIGNELRENHGSDILAKRIVEKVRSDDFEKVVIDAIRHHHEAKYLKNELNAVLIGVTTSQKRRFEFLQKRDRRGDPKTFDEFKKIDDLELKGFGETTQNINKTFQLADHIIQNDGTVEDLRKKVKKFLKNVDQV